ncbi:MAG: NAD-dependent epimerase/dehydratase family protein [Chitinivibrionales bacterium]|nr:NAD-dependent epimerase/dehydratase family protein [Chitinivibrionales bacterium]
MGTTILITGANGFVGRNLVNTFSRNSENTIIATDVQDSRIPLYSSDQRDITYLSGDLSDKEINANLRENYRFDVIIHLAAILSQADDMKTYFSVMDSNIYTTFLLLETARAHSAKVLFPSTALVYGDKKAPFTEDMSSDPGVFYALSKHMSEELIRFYHKKYKIPYNIFRIGILYGPGQHNAMFIPSLITKLLDGEQFDMTKGEQVRDFVYIDDFMRLLQRAMTKKDISGMFNVGTGNAPLMKDVALIAEELTGIKGKINLGGLSYREHEVWEYCLDITKTKNTFGWSPEINLRQGLQNAISYYSQFIK